jgi:membrane fusion protein (multidrug efflux system)
VPIEVATVERRDISSYIETNGTLEAENEVDVLARTVGQIVALEVEEGMRVRRGDLLAKLEQDDIGAQLEISRVELDEAELTYQRAQKLQDANLISEEEFVQAKTAFESARAQYERNRIQFDYTEIRAPFGGWVVTRYVDLGQTVTVNQPMFRISDFTPLLCPIRVPERELPKLRPRQSAYLTVEAWPGRRFLASVLRISPVIDATTGTVKVTLDVDPLDLLRPGMFARVFLETDVHEDTLVIPKAALSLESIGDTVYVAESGKAVRREIRLGFSEGDHVEVLEGLAEGDRVVVVGQDGLSQGTPVRVLRVDGRQLEPAAGRMADSGEGATGPPPAPAAADADGAAGDGPGAGPPDLSGMSPEQIERIKQRMRERGMSEEQIEKRLERAGNDRGSRP